MMMMMVASSRVALMASLVAALRGAAALDRCDACTVVYEGVKETLRLEEMDEDRADILSGGRLDSSGKRNGEVIKYATSEFRSSHLLGQICNVVDTYAYNAPFFQRNPRRWLAYERAIATGKEPPKRLKSHLAAAASFEEHEAMALNVYCDALVEDHEDALSEAVAANSVDDQIFPICADACGSMDAFKAHVTKRATNSMVFERVDDSPKKRRRKKNKKNKAKKNDDL